MKKYSNFDWKVANFPKNVQSYLQIFYFYILNPYNSINWKEPQTPNRNFEFSTKYPNSPNNLYEVLSKQ